MEHETPGYSSVHSRVLISHHLSLYILYQQRMLRSHDLIMLLQEGKAAQGLFNLVQGGRRVANYSIEFKTMAPKSHWSFSPDCPHLMLFSQLLTAFPWSSLSFVAPGCRPIPLFFTPLTTTRRPPEELHPCSPLHPGTECLAIHVGLTQEVGSMVCGPIPHLEGYQPSCNLSPSALLHEDPPNYIYCTGTVQNKPQTRCQTTVIYWRYSVQRQYGHLHLYSLTALIALLLGQPKRRYSAS